jgi:hypothetical protein
MDLAIYVRSEQAGISLAENDGRLDKRNLWVIMM